MAYQKKYWFQFTSIDGRVNVVELWQDAETVITAEEVTADVGPFVVKMPELDDKFQTVRGTGCEIGLISTTDMKFFSGLYHVSTKEFIVKHYVDSLPNWYGYLNSEMARESYSFTKNYQVSVSGNDGFSLMERFRFIGDDDSQYLGIKSKFELIKIIFEKIGLPFGELLINLSTTFAQFSGAAASTILHESYIDCSNFYNEDGEPETLRTVLKSLLAPYAAIITQIQGNIYINDVHTLATGGSITYKRFNLSTGAYIGQITDSANIQDISAIGAMGTDFNIERSGGKNKQVIAYSPYPKITNFENAISTFSEFSAYDVNWSQDDYSKVFYKGLYTNSKIDAFINTDCRFEAVKDGVDKIETYANLAAFPTFGNADKTYRASDTGYYYRWNGAAYVRISNPSDFGGKINIHYTYPYLATNTRLLWLKSGETISVNPPADTGNLLFLNITGKFGVRMLWNPPDSYPLELQNVWLMFRLKVGNKYYNGGGWQTSDTTFLTRISQEGDPIFSSVAKSSSQPLIHTAYPNMINLANDGGDAIRVVVNEPISGMVELELWSDFRTDNRAIHNSDLAQYTEQMFISNLGISISRSDDSEISDADIEYIGLLDENYKDEADKVTLYCGTEATGVDRGKILYSDSGTFKPIFSWTRAAQSFKIEELLLNSLSSNYRIGFIWLNSLKLKNTFDQLNILTDSLYLGDSKMMVKSLSVDYRNNTVDCDCVEIFPDSLTIEK